MEQPASPQPFEVSLDRLEKIVKELESGSPPLERSLELFAEGMQLAEQCRAQLESAESRIEILVRRAGDKVSAEPFQLEREP
jgi:exodeoxyribonuclease VII small subunit